MHQTLISKDLDYETLAQGLIFFSSFWTWEKDPEFLFLVNTQKWDPEVTKVKILILGSFLYKIPRSITKSFGDVKAELWLWIQTVGTAPCEHIHQNF